MRTAVVYARVSTKEQTQNLSLPTQLRECRKYCEREGLTVAREFVEEGESAKSADRTELKKLIEYCRQHKKRVAAVVVVYNVSRFSRDTNSHTAVRTFLATLGISLRSVTEPIDDTPAGKMIEGMLAVVSQFENDQKAERTKVGMRAALERGRWTFKAPLGYRTGRAPGEPSLVPDEDTGPLIRMGFEAIAAGDERADVLRRVTALGLRTERKRRLSAQTWHAMLRNPIYMGRVEVASLGVSAAGDFEALVPAATFEQVQVRLARPGPRVVARKRPHPKFPLTRFVRCAACRTSLAGSASTGRTRKYAYYHCPRCGQVRARREVVEEAFLALLERLQPDEGYMRLFREVVLDVWRGAERGALAERARLEGRVEQLRARHDALDEAFVYQRRIDAASYERQRDKLREETALAQMAQADARASELDIETTLAFAEHLMTNAARMWVEATPAQKRRLQDAFFPEGLSFDGERFGTAVTCLAFRDFQESEPAANGLASPSRFVRRGHPVCSRRPRRLSRDGIRAHDHCRRRASGSQATRTPCVRSFGLRLQPHTRTLR